MEIFCETKIHLNAEISTAIPSLGTPCSFDTYSKKQFCDETIVICCKNFRTRVNRPSSLLSYLEILLWSEHHLFPPSSRQFSLHRFCFLNLKKNNFESYFVCLKWLLIFSTRCSYLEVECTSL